jgi:hypothetical protein
MALPMSGPFCTDFDTGKKNRVVDANMSPVSTTQASRICFKMSYSGLPRSCFCCNFWFWCPESRLPLWGWRSYCHSSRILQTGQHFFSCRHFSFYSGQHFSFHSGQHFSFYSGQHLSFHTGFSFHSCQHFSFHCTFHFIQVSTSFR